MFAIAIDEPGVPSRRVTFTRPELTIGRSEGNELVLTRGAISRRHARLVVKDARFVLVDLRSTNGTFVNGSRIHAPILVKPGDRIRIGDYTLEIEDLIATFADEPTAEWSPEPPAAVDPVEAGLLASIEDGDHASREVYADWLEERGDTRRAAFLRVQEELVALSPLDPQYHGAVTRLRDAAEHVHTAWRMKVARPAIENCPNDEGLEFEFSCPKQWSELAATNRSNVRHCGTCDKPVFYSRSIDEARRHADRGECVALDIVQIRVPGDLRTTRDTEPRMMLGVIAPVGYPR